MSADDTAGPIRATRMRFNDGTVVSEGKPFRPALTRPPGLPDVLSPFSLSLTFPAFEAEPACGDRSDR